MSFTVWIQEGKNYWKLGLQELRVGARGARAAAVLEPKWVKLWSVSDIFFFVLKYAYFVKGLYLTAS